MSLSSLFCEAEFCYQDRKKDKRDFVPLGDENIKYHARCLPSRDKERERGTDGNS